MGVTNYLGNGVTLQVPSGKLTNRRGKSSSFQEFHQSKDFPLAMVVDPGVCVLCKVIPIDGPHESSHCDLLCIYIYSNVHSWSRLSFCFLLGFPRLVLVTRANILWVGIQLCFFPLFLSSGSSYERPDVLHVQPNFATGGVISKRFLYSTSKYGKNIVDI